MIADDTGSIIFTARDDQIEALGPLGTILVLRNAHTYMLRGFMRLCVSKFGKISRHPDCIASTPEAPPTFLTESKSNRSNVEYELVDM